MSLSSLYTGIPAGPLPPFRFRLYFCACTWFVLQSHAKGFLTLETIFSLLEYTSPDVYWAKSHLLHAFNHWPTPGQIPHSEQISDELVIVMRALTTTSSCLAMPWWQLGLQLQPAELRMFLGPIKAKGANSSASGTWFHPASPSLAGWHCPSCYYWWHSGHLVACGNEPSRLPSDGSTDILKQPLWENWTFWTGAGILIWTGVPIPWHSLTSLKSIAIFPWCLVFLIYFFNVENNLHFGSAQANYIPHMHFWVPIKIKLTCLPSKA